MKLIGMSDQNALKGNGMKTSIHMSKEDSYPNLELLPNQATIVILEKLLPT